MPEAHIMEALIRLNSEESAMSRRTPLRTPDTPPGGATRYRDRIFDSKRHDPYAPAGKYTEPTRCSECGAVYHRGRWQWAHAQEGAATKICPACHRIADNLPAGVVILEGAFVSNHRSELLGIVRNEADHERGEHPMHRIMRVDEYADRVEIATTDIHLPQRIGEAIRRAHHGDLRVEYAEDEYNVRVCWRG